MGHTEMFAAEGQALRIDIEDNDFGSGLNSKLHHGQSDGTRSNDEHEFACLHARAIDGVAADRERFDQRQLVQR